MKNLTLLLILSFSFGFAQNNLKSTWQSPPKDILDVLYAPKLPRTSTAPNGAYILLTDPVVYPTLSELAAPMHKLAGLRVNPKNNYYHGYHGGTNPRLLKVDNGEIINLDLPEKAEILRTEWTSNGKKFALMVGFEDRVELWMGKVDGSTKKVPNIIINPLIDLGVRWLPDQKRLLIRRINNRGEAPQKPTIPTAPKILESTNATATSTYEARNLLETSYDDEAFSHFTSCELVIYNPETDEIKTIGKTDNYTNSSFSPDGNYILVERVVAPWSHEVAFWRFATEIEIWDPNGKLVSKIASLPVANQVPTHGVSEGPRFVSWNPSEASTLYWTEALDGGDPLAKAEYRDRIMKLKAPFKDEAEEVFKAEHRIIPYQSFWGQGENQNILMLTQRERMKRHKYVWLLDIDKGTSKQWFDFDESDVYANPGYPVFTKLKNGKRAFKIKNNKVYFKGKGGTPEGDRPFLDLRDITNNQSERVFRCDPEKYEHFIDFADDDQFILSSESSKEVPNLYLAKLGKKVKAEKGETTRQLTKQPITDFKDPTPELRKIEKRLIKYKREDGVELSFQLLLPPNYEEGTKLPTVLYAYPLEYSGAKTAGQVRGSTRRYMRIYGPSHKFFLMRGYAVLDNTAMPMIGDPETVYDTFVPQLVADAEAAVSKAVEIGIADPERIGVIGHSHGGLMVANLLAHTDLFSAGIARSGSYNKTNQPFGFQGERRSLFEARDVYIQVSPTFFADKVNEPVLVIHGNDDSNPGTLTPQSEVFYEAVKGSGGTARLVLLPFEDHGYRAKESVEHVIWEQLEWFDKYVKNKKDL
ncbi:MAG: prolyl oligopeptidase family serine peptidase [Flavobacteriales bacterium]|nr:prolyl oligopeptidase family serine peptidase [Flavobacteriales bacterium]